MAKKIKKKKTRVLEGAVPRTPLATAFRDVANPVLDVVGSDPVPATMTWAMGLVATAWNASRNMNELEGLAQLNRAIDGLKTPGFSDGEQIGTLLEEVFHLARVRHPRDPRHAIKLFVEKRGAGDFHVEVVGGIPKKSV